MTQTKLPEPVQVGLWYETDLGAYTCITDTTTYDGDLYPYIANNGERYNCEGETYDQPNSSNLIRCLGADPFKQVKTVVTGLDAAIVEADSLLETDFDTGQQHPKWLVTLMQAATAKPTTPTQTGGETPSVMVAPAAMFERIFTAVLGALISKNLHDWSGDEKVTAAIEYTQEAIKQLKEIEVA